ncbi:MAG: Phosphoribosylaminoimidazole-succinocarboxamide synthase [Synergistales bacterium 54_24]|nr:MAG: Phosphoribosylaminoimidazole-succinocarboxamide synthase [Synergistales bacterium 54_24]HAF51145.1 phosphoribosylaminoimidazolesuccinocarboxamide synthase [Synergistaceae bacterium]HOM24670.1 phosphoribosylaminoimidazolesuccinocarboxamide synthase [Thermosynergistes sp.]
MTKGELLYEGKAKKLYATDDPALCVMEYKDELTAFNALKKATMAGKGRLNNLISSKIFEHLNASGFPTHFIRRLDELNQLVKRVTIVPLEVVVRNLTTGSICKRLGVQEGMRLPRPLVEFYLKNDALGDPLVLEDHALLFGWATEEELGRMKKLALDVNKALSELFEKLNIFLVDFKLEFGKDRDGNLVIADEVSPDTCRLWDRTSGDRLDKDRFRKDMGNVLEAYEEIWRRLEEMKA